MARRPILLVENLTVTRSGTPIIRDISWRVEPGQHWVILGANGSGKTSLLSALTGYLMPTSGQIHVLGKRYGSSDWRELRKSIGLVSSSVRQMIPEEEPALRTVASGRDAIVGLDGDLAPDVRSFAKKILADLACPHLADRRWEVLSQGERQRILIGRALMARPRLLILDEPCAGLDPVAREDFLERIDLLAARPRGPSLVLVTHHIEEITPAFRQILLLLEGRVLREGPKKEILTSRLLRQTFGRPVRVQEEQNRYRMLVRKDIAHAPTKQKNA